MPRLPAPSWRGAERLRRARRGFAGQARVLSLTRGSAPRSRFWLGPVAHESISNFIGLSRENY